VATLTDGMRLPRIRHELDRRVLVPTGTTHPFGLARTALALDVGQSFPDAPLR